MKKVFLGMLLLAWLMAVPIPTRAEVDVNVSIGLPLPIVFAGPPELVVLPETYVYAVPDIEMDLFFYGGWWWRPWQGHWYRSHYYNSGWGYYQGVPSFYRGIPSGWRNDYRNHRWRGHRWNYQRIHHQQVERNWGSWEKSKHWERQQTWGVQGLRHQTRSQEPSRGVQQQGNHERGKVEQQHQKAGPQSKEGNPQESQQQKGNHEKGKGENQDKR